jgi:hypothetical protein
VATWAENLGVSTYIGLTSEGLAPPQMSFLGRHDFDRNSFAEAAELNVRGVGT